MLYFFVDSSSEKNIRRRCFAGQEEILYAPGLSKFYSESYNELQRTHEMFTAEVALKSIGFPFWVRSKFSR